VLLVQLTVVFDTTHLTPEMRKYLAPVSAALGAFVCPRPPGLDTDAEITDPNEFDPPMDIADSQVSIGLNGEMMQSMFMTVIVRPEKYAWAVGLLNYIMTKVTFTPSFLKFVALEAARGLASNYKMQTAEKPNYDCFDSVEINLHSLIKQVYKEGSTRHRAMQSIQMIDCVLLIMRFWCRVECAAVRGTKETGHYDGIPGRARERRGKDSQDDERGLAELGQDRQDCCADCSRREGTEDASRRPRCPLEGKLCWNEEASPVHVSHHSHLFVIVFILLVLCRIAQPVLEPRVMNDLSGTGKAVSVNQPRVPCLSIAAKINPSHSDDFPKICMASQLFSMAQKWIWSCWDLDDYCSPVIRMPCSYANLITLNLESYDVIGSLKTMRKMILEDWSWVGPLLIATKLMVVNDPACLEVGAQGTIASALLSHLGGQSMEARK